ncbi:Dihydroxyacetone kinase [Pleurostoma richardsiae]|uniref:Dihydroxyacetone kinase n=1 Tax=Pleurostoma richardsiae TaxID=41990 RepID=A0AA38R3S6_9PEZI|nr:Dihydroxyacetone kinase [Pleurostoma richardsiae]
MSKRHIFNSADGLVDKSLRGLISYNPSLGLNPANRVVFDSRHDKSKISIISGGGSGHEPAWSGYVGQNMLTASVAGDIFASPSTSQILAAIETVPSDTGVLLVVTNYTGDCLHFGLANEKALQLGHRCRMIICGDDVAVGRKHGRLVGRRGLAGQICVLKILGGAAGAGIDSLDNLYDLGSAVSGQIVSIAATLDHCHVPGRGDHSNLGPDEVEIGTGPHNEPGYKKLSPVPSSESLVQQLLSYLLDQSDPERAFARFGAGDEVVLLVNNFGGISYLEIGALVDEVLEQLHKDWAIEPIRVFTGVIESSLNAPAITLSLVNITAASKACSFSTEQIKTFLDAKTDTHWESMVGSQSRRTGRQLNITAVSPLVKNKAEIKFEQATRVDISLMRRMLLAACKAVIEAEPELTRWDTVMGDGDCGETLKTGALNILDRLESPEMTHCDSVLMVLQEIEAVVERKMGGTLGGILGIFLVALTNGVRSEAASGRASIASSLWGPALSSAIAHLEAYTKARVGDRTVMDVLIPFSEAMVLGDFNQAVAAAVKGAEITKTLRPKLGRATYVAAGFDGDRELPPDPGAWGVMVAIRGLQLGLQGS